MLLPAFDSVLIIIFSGLLGALLVTPSSFTSSSMPWPFNLATLPSPLLVMPGSKLMPTGTVVLTGAPSGGRSPAVVSVKVLPTMSTAQPSPLDAKRTKLNEKVRMYLDDIATYFWSIFSLIGWISVLFSHQYLLSWLVVHDVFVQ